MGQTLAGETLAESSANNAEHQTPDQGKPFEPLRDESLEQLANSTNARTLAKSLEENPVPSEQPQAPGALPQPVRPETPAIPSNTAISALLDASTPTASLALEQLAAGSNANLAKATLSSASPVSASMLSAMHQLGDREGTQGSGSAPRLAAGGEGGGRVWLQALGHGGKVDRDFDSVLKHSTHGLVLGADWRFDEQWHLGLMGAKAQTRFDARQFDGDLDSWHLGAYALRQDGPFALRLGASYGDHDGSGKRRVAFNGFSDRLKSSYKASTQQVFAEVGYNLGRGNVSIEPFAGVGYQRYQRDDYTEKGGDAALKVHGQTQANPTSTVGLRMAKTSHLPNGLQLTPRLSASMKHTYGTLDTETRQQLVKGGKSFEVTGAGMDRNIFALDAGLDLTLSTHNTLGVGISGDAGSDSRSYGVTGQWRMEF
ncbi:MAG TPA: autotransporter domain-containing protein [Pseudomonas sp.]|nr:autotransporter domain-containing protein [Pseudomonas sp.]HEX4548865.1 autotransporter domain-containing protein [Pseudomonas sp.]